MELQNSQLKSQKEKKVEDKNRNKSNGNKQNIVMNMVGYLPCSIIPASTNDLNTPTNRQRLSEWIKKRE